MNSIEAGVDSTSEIVPQIADHVLLRRIGRGAYGEVWLAKNVMGGFRAVKVIYRRRFMSERPFQCEFEGICKFEPISRLHPGLVTILHVGKNEQAGYFYCVMELADDARTGQAIDPDAYLPRSLKEEMETHPHRPLNTSLQIALSLTSALGYLHGRGLIHRDIKPSNIIFVNGVPKIADVGLVTEAGEDVSGRGTPYYMPSEGPGEPTADIFGLGKVFYELFMGLHPKHFPDLPGAAEEFTSVPELLRINNLILKACHHDPRQRFQTTAELHKALQSVAETVQKRQGTMVPTSSDSAKPAAETLSKPATIHPEKTTAAPEGRRVASGERPTAQLTRRAALIGVGGAIAGGAVLPLIWKGDPIVVIMDTTASGGIYDIDSATGKPVPGASNTTEVRKALEILGLVPPLKLYQEPIDLNWSGQSRVRALRPHLVVVHRSSFYHPVNTFLKLGRPPIENPERWEDWEKWNAIYHLAEEKLIDFMGYVGSHVARTRFLVYSRGTDRQWLDSDYRDEWRNGIERTYAELKGRIFPMVIPNEYKGSFRETETRELLGSNVVRILNLKLPEYREARKSN